MLIGILGDLGSGKTLLATYLAYKMSSKIEYDVYANYQLNIPNCKSYISPIQLMEINPPHDKRALVVLDEAYTWLDSRVSISHINRYISWIILQSRKRNMDIIHTEQLNRLIDVRLKELNNMIFYAENLGKGFKYTLVYRKGLRTFQKTFWLPYSYAKNLFSLYDTREIVKPLALEQIKADVMLDVDQTELKKEVDQIVDKIKPKLKGKKVTRSVLAVMLMEMGKPRQLLDFVYGKLKLLGF